MAGFIFEPRYETVTYPEGEDGAPGWAGFQARILCNPTGAERRAGQRAFAAYREKNASADTEDAFWQTMAPRIVEWNYERRQPDGTTKTLPPPCENWENIYELEPAVWVWLALQILTAHVPKVQALMEGPDSPSDVGIMDSTPPTPLRRKNSSKRSVSTLTA